MEHNYIRTALLFLAFSTVSFGQVYNPGKDIVDAFEKGTRVRLEGERLEMDRQRQTEELRLMRQRQTEELRLMRVETERLQAEAEHLKAQSERLWTGSANSAQATAIRLEMDAAYAELRLSYPDFDKYDARMAHAAEVLVPAAAKQLSVKSYLECLYVVAKHAKFLDPAGNAVSPIPDGDTPKPQAKE